MRARTQNNSFLLIAISVLFYLLSGCAVQNTSPLMASVRSGDTKLVDTLITLGVDVNELAPDRIGNKSWKVTPLIRASISGDISIIKKLLQAGAYVNGRDEYGDTALMATVEFGHIEAAKILLDYGALVNQTKPNKTTALMIASRKGSVDIARLLLEADADPNVGLGSGDTALSLAAGEGHIGLVRLLIENGAKIDRTAMDRALKNNHQNVFELLSLHQDVNTPEMFSDIDPAVLISRAEIICQRRAESKLWGKGDFFFVEKSTWYIEETQNIQITREIYDEGREDNNYYGIYNCTVQDNEIIHFYISKSIFFD